MSVEAYQQLEIEFGEFVGNSNTVACSSGTAALHLALETLRVTEQWTERTYQVVLPDYTMVACPRAVSLTANLTPFLHDVGELGLLPPTLSLQTDYGVPTSCVMSVHLYGRQAPTDYGELPVIEDLAEAHGVPPNKSSLAACYSFYKNKVIAGEEGGMVVFKTEEQASLAKKLRCLGMEDGHFTHIPRGMNYRLSNCHAQLILASLRNYETNLSRRKEVELWYNVHIPKELQLPNRNVPWVYDLNTPVERSPISLVTKLNNVGVAARTGFKPISTQKEYAKTNRTTVFKCLELHRRRIYLPIRPEMKKSAVYKICNHFKKFARI